ncbi:MAG: HAMP domain-containing histidine kinase [Marinifilaceae bacterium]|jgi:two-component system phosphate regulon sensor histidine kinase PhoR|nr:HAMP domain-containing histidine kinase [Marinifilaceae bacterium]
MNQKYIWLVTIILCLSLFGLIIVQIRYFQSASRIRKEQFDLTVNIAMDQVVSSLKTEDLSNMILSSEYQEYNNNIYQENKGRQLSGMSIYIPVGPKNQKNAELNVYEAARRKSLLNTFAYPRYKKRGQGLSSSNDKIHRDFEKNQQSEVDDLVKFVNQLKRSALKIEDRINLEKVKDKIYKSLKDNGIKLEFEYAIKSENNYEKYSKNYFANNISELYSKQLFADGIIKSNNFLCLYFPTKANYLVGSYSMLIPSFVLIVILVLCSVFTILIIFRQKKVSNIKNDFINNMTHEFKTPISTISLASQMLKDSSIMGSTSSSVDNIAKIINDESKRLTYQVEKVLQMAIFNESRMKLKLKTIQIHTVIQNLLPNFIIRVEDKKGNMYQNLDAVEDEILADEVHVSNVIMNLLDNAVKYSKDAPEISISTRNRDKWVVISVTDNGIGISKDDQKMIFERFFRVHTGNVHNVKGFGLGLSYVKKIVDAHSGVVQVESTLNKGSKFEVYLPLKK